MSSAIQKQLDTIKLPVPNIQHAAVKGLFDLIIGQGGQRSEEARSALQSCLVDKSQVREIAFKSSHVFCTHHESLPIHTLLVPSYNALQSLTGLHGLKPCLC